MKIVEDSTGIVLEGVEDFDIEQILECGQCFNFERLDNKEYVLTAKGHLLHIKQTDDNVVFYNTDLDTYKNVWHSYFDMDRDYSIIKQWLVSNEKRVMKKEGLLKEAIAVKYGVRILNQEFFETLISFIISQNKQIPHIKQIVNMLSVKYGKYLGTVNDKEYYSFPDLEQLRQVPESDIRLCKTGFRAPYILDACQKVYDKTVDEQRALNAGFNECIDELMKIKGVGNKVANCVALFSLNKRESFPIDVWVKRIMENIYFNDEDTKKEDIARFASKLYGNYGGYAQQYLFYYGREIGLGTNK